MLKKVVLGIVGFIFVVIAGAAIYIYTLDWNKHKTLVSQRLTQITGLKSQINGNLKVEFFPKPKITAGRVSFFSNGENIPLVEINEISANLELKPLLDNNFIINSMTFTHPTVNIIISEKGDLNWKNVGKNSNNKSGNVEMSFSDVKLNNAIISYHDKQNNKEFTIPNITASVSAPSLTGPYKTNGKSIHNNSEIKFQGNILKNPNLKLKLTVDNAATGSKFDIDGEVGSVAKGNLTFDTRSLTDVVNVIFGENTFNNNYKEPLFVSFQYDYNNGTAKLDNFNIKYSNNNVGNGSALVKSTEKNKELAADFNMAQFDLTFVENLSRDYIRVIKATPSANDNLLQYSAMFNIKAANALYKETAVQNLAMELSLKDNILGLTRFSALFPGETNIRTVGKVNLKDNLQFIFNQSIDSKDLRTFASIFGVNLLKSTPEGNKKSVFKNAKAELKISGDLETLKLSFPKATIDATDFSGDFGFITKEEQLFVLADITASKILFDKYLQIIPDEMKNSSYKDKFIQQMKLIPWDKNVNVEADVDLASAVYNKIPMEKISLQFSSHGDQLNVKKLSFGSFAGAELNTAFTADNIFTAPSFDELSYSIKTSNFPYLTSTLGIDTGKKDLFKRKIFASQGNMSGSFEAFNLSSVQKFGETEFSYTGAVLNTQDNPVTVNGDFEFKSNNALNFIKALNFDYIPDVPTTSFTSAGKLKGSYEIFEYSDINAYLGANNIKGYIQLDHSSALPILKSELSFDKFDANRWFKLNKKVQKTSNTMQGTFISLPEFDNTAIDYSTLLKANFDIKANTDVLVYDNKTYNKAVLAAKLKNGILNVESFETKTNGNNIVLSFILNSTNAPTIEGKYNISGIKTPALGGSTYRLDSGILNAEGSFNSSAYSQKDFLENLDSNGKFQLTDTTMKGWDLDIIKFDLEQRKDTTGFEDAVAHNLQTGQSVFNKISGVYKISKGVIIADKVLWESPVVDMNMQLNLNLSERLFTALFGAVYHNASFSDILKFTMKGELANPTMELDISESLARLSQTEKQMNTAKETEYKEKREKLSGRITSAQTDAEFILKEISNILRTAEEYKPISSNRAAAQLYAKNIQSLREMENKIKDLQLILTKSADDKVILDAESKLGIEKSKLKFLPKTFEENFIADSKNAYDETLNKIIWLYNTATNNSTYYNDLTDVYIHQMEILKKAEQSLSEKSEEQLIAGIKKISGDMDKIEKLHAKIRDDYLFIMDVTSAAEMQDNNTAIQKTLQTMLSYVNLLNKDILDSLTTFRETLDMQPRDDAEYLVFPPENATDIDVSKPVVRTSSTPKKDDKPQNESASQKNSNEKENISIPEEVSSVEQEESLPNDEDASLVEPQKSTSDKEEAAKKKIEALTTLQSLKSGIGQFLQKINPLQEKNNNFDIASSLSFSGLSQMISSKPEPVTSVEIAEKETVQLTQEISSVKSKAASTEAELEINLAEQDIATPSLSDTPIVKTEENSVSANIVPEEPKALQLATNISDKPVLVKQDNVTSTEPEIEINLAEQDIVTPEFPDNSIVETNEISEPIETLQLATNISAQQTLINQDNASLDNSAQSAGAISEIIEKTQTALNDMLAQIKDSEQQLQTPITKQTTVKTDISTPAIDIAQYILPAVQTESRRLKRNPVIAMNIGKELSPQKDIPFAGTMQKSAFKSKKTAFNNLLQVLPNVDKTEVSQTVIHTSSQKNMPDLFDISIRNASTEITQPISKTNKYLFAAQNKTLSASGNVGKTVTNNIVPTHQPMVDQKYLFTTHGAAHTKFRGSVGKNITLAVK